MMLRYFTKKDILNEEEVVNSIKEWSYPLKSKEDLQPLMDRIGDARIVMLGEASHGTHEYYTWRAHITKRLIEEKGFNFIAVEGEWPDCYRLNRFIKGYDTEHKSVRQVLQSFNRWPAWMWANWETVALANWLKQYNLGLSEDKKIGFYGLDLYSLWESLESIMKYLERVDPAAIKLAEEVYQCFEPYRENEGASYARTLQAFPNGCQSKVVRLLKVIRQKLSTYNTDSENVFSVEQNALIAVNAERFYSAMNEGGPHSWNLRDRHMADSLDRLLRFHGDNSKVIVWAHNTHIGDARATDMDDDGMFNIGELARREYCDKRVVLVGFGSYKGTVRAARKWEGPVQTMKLPEAKKGSWEYLLHKAGKENKLLIMDDFSSNELFTENHIVHRAVGVVYNPKMEQHANYVPTILPMRYDAFIYLDETKALHPLHVQSDGHQMPETYPFGV